MLRDSYRLSLRLRLLLGPPILLAPLAAAAVAPTLEVQGLLRSDAGATEETVAPGAALASGDEVRLRVTAGEDGYLYVIAIGSSGSAVALKPFSGAEPVPVRAGEPTPVPDDGGYLPLDDRPGTETFVAFVSPVPLTSLASMLVRLEVAGESAAADVLAREGHDAAAIRIDHQPAGGVPASRTDAGPAGLAGPAAGRSAGHEGPGVLSGLGSRIATFTGAPVADVPDPAAAGRPSDASRIGARSPAGGTPVPDADAGSAGSTGGLFSGVASLFGFGGNEGDEKVPPPEPANQAATFALGSTPGPSGKLPPPTAGRPPDPVSRDVEVPATTESTSALRVGRASVGDGASSARVPRSVPTGERSVRALNEPVPASPTEVSIREMQPASVLSGAGPRPTGRFVQPLAVEASVAIPERRSPSVDPPTSASPGASATGASVVPAPHPGGRVEGTLARLFDSGAPPPQAETTSNGRGRSPEPAVEADLPPVEDRESGAVREPGLFSALGALLGLDPERSSEPAPVESSTSEPAVPSTGDASTPEAPVPAGRSDTGAASSLPATSASPAPAPAPAAETSPRSDAGPGEEDVASAGSGGVLAGLFGSLGEGDEGPSATEPGSVETPGAAAPVTGAPRSIPVDTPVPSKAPRSRSVEVGAPGNPVATVPEAVFAERTASSLDMPEPDDRVSGPRQGPGTVSVESAVVDASASSLANESDSGSPVRPMPLSGRSAVRPDAPAGPQGSVSVAAVAAPAEVEAEQVSAGAGKVDKAPGSVVAQRESGPIGFFARLFGGGDGAVADRGRRQDSESVAAVETRGIGEQAPGAVIIGAQASADDGRGVRHRQAASSAGDLAGSAATATEPADPETGINAGLLARLFGAPEAEEPAPADLRTGPPPQSPVAGAAAPQPTGTGATLPGGGSSAGAGLPALAMTSETAATPEAAPAPGAPSLVADAAPAAAPAATVQSMTSPAAAASGNASSVSQARSGTEVTVDSVASASDRALGTEVPGLVRASDSGGTETATVAPANVTGAAEAGAGMNVGNEPTLIRATDVAGRRVVRLQGGQAPDAAAGESGVLSASGSRIRALLNEPPLARAPDGSGPPAQAAARASATDTVTGAASVTAASGTTALAVSGSPAAPSPDSDPLAGIPPSVRPQLTSAPGPVSPAAAPAPLAGTRIDLLSNDGPAGAVVMVVTPDGAASGVLVDAGGRVLTNWHAIQGNDTVVVVFKREGTAGAAGGVRRPARVVAHSKFSDLALLAVDGLPAGHVPATLAGTAADVEGSLIHVLGPGADGTWHHVLVRDARVRRNSSWYSLSRVLHRADVIRAEVVSGERGPVDGPLFNDRLELVGLGAMLRADRGELIGISADTLRAFLESTG